MWEADGLIPDLEKICPVEVLNLRPVLRGVGEWNQKEAVLKAVQNFVRAGRDLEPDLVFLYLRGGLLSDETISMVRKAWPCPLVGMNLDDRVTFWNYNLFSSGDENYKAYAARFDLNLTNSLIASEWYRQYNLPFHYVAQGVYHPVGMVEPHLSSFRYPLSFLGSMKLDRAAIINQLQTYELQVETFGGGWPNAKWVDNPNDIYRSSQINLGIGSATINLATIKGRDFECPGVGGCYLTSYNWELASWWEIGKEILCYRNIEEAVEIISYYRRRPEECLRIGQAAFRRAAREHTWERRFRKLFTEQLGFKLPQGTHSTHC